MSASKLQIFLLSLTTVLCASCTQVAQLSDNVRHEFEYAKERLQAPSSETPVENQEAPIETYRPPGELFDMEESAYPPPPAIVTAVDPRTGRMIVVPAGKEPGQELVKVVQKPKGQTYPRRHKPTKIISAEDETPKRKKTSKPKPKSKPKSIAPPKEIEFQGPPLKSTTELAEGQTLVNPSASDVLASIEGNKPKKQESQKSGLSLFFDPGETRPDINMKNKILSEFVPKAKNQPNRILIQAYAPHDRTLQEIAALRAHETQDFLIGAGIDASRISVMPLADNIENAAYNRIDIIENKASK